jgi:hypothetical protein
MPFATPTATLRSAETSTNYLSGSTTIASTGTIANGSTLVVAGSVWNFENQPTWISSVTDNKGNTYTVTHRESGADDNAMVFLAEAVNVTGGSDVSITINFGTANGWNSIQYVVAEITNVEASPFDKLVTGTSFNTTSITPTSTGTLSQTDEIAIAVVGGYANATSTPSGWTELAYADQVLGDNPCGSFWFGYDVVTANTAIQPTWTHNTGSFGAILRTYKTKQTGSIRIRCNFDSSKLTSSDTGITALVWRGAPTSVTAIEFTGLSGSATAGVLYIDQSASGFPTNMTVGETVNVLAYNSADTSGLITATVESY